MQVTCAWRGKDMGEKEPLDNKDTTHGMCQECYDTEMENLQEARQGLMELREKYNGTARKELK